MKQFIEYDFTKSEYQYHKQYTMYLKINLSLLLINAALGFYLVQLFLSQDVKDTPYYLSTMNRGIYPMTACYLGVNKAGNIIKPTDNVPKYYNQCVSNWKLS